MNQNLVMIASFDSLAIVMANLALMESALLGMKQVRQYVGKRLATKTLDTLIEEAESQITELKRRMMN